MKPIFLLATMAFAYAMADTSVQYAGTTKGGFAWNPPILGGTTTCTASTGNNYGTVFFNITFTSAGVREIAAMAEHNFKDSLRIYIYLGGFPTAPCMNLAITEDLTKQFDFGGGPVIDDFVYFTAATYTFVVTGDTGGIFAVHINPSDAVGQLTSGSPLWTQPESTGTSSGKVGTCEEVSGSSDAPFATYTFTQAVSGYYDVIAMFVNDTNGVGYGAYLTLYSGIPTTQDLTINPCNTTTATWLATSSSGADGTLIPYVNVTAGANYTLVVSLEPGYYGYWAVQVIPTRIRFFNPTGFVQPNREYPETTTTTGGCTASSLNAPWGATFFTAQESVYVIDTADVPEPFHYVDTYSFLYIGLNSGNPPSTCSGLQIGGDTGDITPVYAYTEIGVNYTVIVSTYSLTTIPTGGAYSLYFFTGNAIGTIPSITTGAAATTGAATTGAGTTGAATTVTGGATTNGAATTVTGAATTATTTHAAATGTTTSGAVSGVTLSVAAAAAILFSVLL